MEQGQTKRVETDGIEHDQTEDQSEGMEQGQTDSMEQDCSSEQEESTTCNETKTEDGSKTEAESELAVAAEDAEVADTGVDKSEDARRKENVEKKPTAIHPFFCKCILHCVVYLYMSLSTLGLQARLLCEL